MHPFKGATSHRRRESSSDGCVLVIKYPLAVGLNNKPHHHLYQTLDACLFITQNGDVIFTKEAITNILYIILKFSEELGCVFVVDEAGNSTTAAIISHVLDFIKIIETLRKCVCELLGVEKHGEKR